MTGTLLNNLFRKGAAGLVALSLLLSILVSMPGMGAVGSRMDSDICGYAGSQTPATHDQGGDADHQCPACVFQGHLSFLPSAEAADQLGVAWAGVVVSLAISGSQWTPLWGDYDPVIPRAPPFFA